jgi:hypothetical protein
MRLLSPCFGESGALGTKQRHWTKDRVYDHVCRGLVSLFGESHSPGPYLRDHGAGVELDDLARTPTSPRSCRSNSPLLKPFPFSMFPLPEPDRNEKLLHIRLLASRTATGVARYTPACSEPSPAFRPGLPLAGLAVFPPVCRALGFAVSARHR